MPSTEEQKDQAILDVVSGIVKLLDAMTKWFDAKTASVKAGR